MKKCYFLLLMSCAMLILSGNAAAQNLPAYLPSNGLVAWYPFNGNANDESGNGNHGTVNGNGNLVSDQNGNVESAYFFDAWGDYIDIPDNLNGLSTFGLTFRISSFACCYNGQVGAALFSNFTNDFNPGPNGIEIGFSMSNQIGLGNGISGLSFGAFSPEVNTWYKLIVVIDGSNVKIYINGVLVSEANDFIYSSQGANFIRLGGRANLTSDQFLRFMEFNGIIDDVFIYNRAISASEVENYSNGVANNTGSNLPVPPGIPYQAVVRNANGQVAANAAATTKFTLHQNTTDGAVEYQETHALNTNAQGLVSAVIGQGTAVQGTFGGINWSNTTKFLQVEVDLGNGFVDLGTQQLMSVPFALYAANGPAGPQGPAGADGADGADGATGPAGPQGPAANLSVSQTGDTLFTGNGNFILIPGISAANFPPAILGCTDNNACNYNNAATQNDNSCLYFNATCDDGNANTTNDVVNISCQCQGTVIGNGIYIQGNGVTDIDGNYYPTIIINGQEWMQQNLAVSRYRNGDPIPTGLSVASWLNTASGAYATYNNDVANNTLYGKLYNWYAVSDGRGLCPAGWHVPSDLECTNLENFLGGANVAGPKLKSLSLWEYNLEPNATNISGFSAVPCGRRNGVETNGAAFNGLLFVGTWWTSTELNSNSAWFRLMFSDDPAVYRTTDVDKHGGVGVRCLHD